MRKSLQKMRPLHSNLVPPQGAVPDGATPEGKPLWKLVTQRTRAVPLLDEKGEQVYRRHAVTGEPLVKRNKHQEYTHTEVFYLESDGRGNVNKIFYKPPTQEDLAAAKRTQDIQAMQSRLAETLVDEGLDPADFARALRSKGAAPSVSAPAEVLDPDDEFPVHLGGGYYRFSDGEKLQMKKDDALAHQAELSEQQAQVKLAAAGAF